jgi:hypothetical protein
MGKDELGAALLVVGALLACKGSDQRTQERLAAATSASARPRVVVERPVPSAATPLRLENIPDAPCVLNAAGKPHVPIFPSVEAIREWNDALARKDWDAAEAARKGERAFLVESGTKCTRLDIDLDVARVRIVTGKRLGEIGWTRREWSFAKGKDDDYEGDTPKQ